LIDQWGKLLGEMPPGPRIGLAWATEAGDQHDRARSVNLSALAPLAAIAGATFYSLQRGPAAAQLRKAPPGMNIIDHMSRAKDMADTAALISHLDLVISVETAVAHLAGAMAKPTRVLLPFLADWRWMTGREDSPWYPTMTLYRQPAPGDWSTPLARLAADVASVSPQR
jgi:hypothetical protein